MAGRGWQGRAGRRRAAFGCACAALVCVLIAAMGAARFVSAPGDKVFKDSGLQVDYTNAAQGYLMVRYTKETSKKIALRVSKDDVTLTYFLTPQADYTAIPLQLGSGTYRLAVYKQKSGKEYTAVTSKKFKVTLEDESAAFLLPSQYVWYNENTLAVIKSNELCEGLSTDAEKFRAIWNYVTTNIFYDYFLATSVKQDYLPVLDDIVTNQKGICFDYASLLACMLRVQEIPTKLCIGYAGKTYHAWNSVYLSGEWTMYDPTFATTGAKASQYTLERSY